MTRLTFVVWCVLQDADGDIIRALKAKGRLVHQGQIDHSYPFCWRSETPLLYRV
jgi:isoleucyl-tRNA synthetase